MTSQFSLDNLLLYTQIRFQGVSQQTGKQPYFKVLREHEGRYADLWGTEVNAVPVSDRELRLIAWWDPIALPSYVGLERELFACLSALAPGHPTAHGAAVGFLRQGESTGKVPEGCKGFEVAITYVGLPEGVRPKAQSQATHA